MKFTREMLIAASLLATTNYDYNCPPIEIPRDTNPELEAANKKIAENKRKRDEAMTAKMKSTKA